MGCGWVGIRVRGAGGCGLGCGVVQNRCLVREHILWCENTFYSQRTHSVVRKLVSESLSCKNYLQREKISIVRQHVLRKENTF